MQARTGGEQRSLPKNWKQTKARGGQVYYYNTVTRQTSLDLDDLPPPLPPKWQEAVDKKSGERYYWNISTRESRRMFPPWPQPNMAVIHTQPPDADSNRDSVSGTSCSEAATSEPEIGTVPKEEATFCIICMVGPKVATLVHGETGHLCCCFPCARQLKARAQPCPVCREPVELVIRQFTV